MNDFPFERADPDPGGMGTYELLSRIASPFSLIKAAEGAYDSARAFARAAQGGAPMTGPEALGLAGLLPFAAVGGRALSVSRGTASRQLGADGDRFWLPSDERNVHYTYPDYLERLPKYPDRGMLVDPGGRNPWGHIAGIAPDPESPNPANPAWTWDFDIAERALRRAEGARAQPDLWSNQERAALPGVVVHGLAQARTEAPGLPGRGELPGGAGLLQGPFERIPSETRIPGYGVVQLSPIPWLEAAGRDYMRRAGIEGDIPRLFPRFDPERARRIAQAYDEMVHDPANPQVRASYDAMIEETIRQWQAAQAAGLNVEFLRPGMADPYAASPALGYLDMLNNRHLWVFPTDQGFGTLGQTFEHPLLQATGIKVDGRELLANDLFRIVHDVFGHNAPGNPFFRAPGEERAWRLHSAMYSPEARNAMTGETRGQNSWVNYGPYGEQNRAASAADTVYADQKAGLMPEWTLYGQGMPFLAPLVRRREDGAIEEFY